MNQEKSRQHKRKRVLSPKLHGLRDNFLQRHRPPPQKKPQKPCAAIPAAPQNIRPAGFRPRPPAPGPPPTPSSPFLCFPSAVANFCGTRIRSLSVEKSRLNSSMQNKSKEIVG